MADPLLTSLCVICHVEAPKYKCPRCSIRTCSLACTKRHKTWSSCNGIRDATAYVPPSKLKTAAGVDHDYNFLSGIERAVQRSEKEIVEERHLLRPEDLRPIEVRSVQWKVGRDGRRRRVLVTEVLRGDNNAGGRAAEVLSSVPVRKRLDKFGILLRRAPVGMARQRENATTFSKASGRVNWQVEWLLLSETTSTQQGEKGQDDDETPKIESKRVLAKALDDTPLYKAFAMGKKSFHDDLARKEHQRLQRQEDGDEPDESRDNNAASGGGPGGRHKKRRKHPHKPGQSLATAQDTETGAWHFGRYCLQGNNPCGAWTPHTGVPAFTGTTEEEEAQKIRYSFFLAGTTSAVASAAGHTVVHAVDATLPLGEALRDMTVLEFPTIYVAESGSPLPGSLVSEPKPVRLTQKRKRDSNQQPFGRKGGKGANKKLRRDLEDGELRSRDDDDDDDESDDAGEDDGRFGAVDQVIAEESLGEDEDDESATSSSGSDEDEDEDVAASLAAKLALLEKRRP